MRKSLDFSAKFDKKFYHIEVAYLQGPSFKTQKKLIFNGPPPSEPVYELQAKKLINRLKTICNEKEKQAVNHGSDPSNALILLISDLDEMHEPWLQHDEFQGQHPIQGLVTSREFPTIILAPGTVYEPGAAALDGAFGRLQQFDWLAFEELILKNTEQKDESDGN